MQCPNSQNYHPPEDVAGLTHHQKKGIRHLKNVIEIEGDTHSLSRSGIQMS